MERGHKKIINKYYPETSSEFVDIDGVRFTPPRIEFTYGVYRKRYRAQFVMQNVGKNRAFIRIPQVDTKDFELEFLPRGLYLSPGLKVIKAVKLNYYKECSRECMVCIYVNERKYDYLLTLKTDFSTISINPEVLDFGLINAGNIHAALVLLIRNDGDKDQLFALDLGDCSESVIVEPRKGRIRAHTTYEVGVKIVGFVPSEICTTFQIKCAHQTINVPIKGKIIISKLEAVHPFATRHFTLLEFPPTYFGLSSEILLFVRNYSAIPYMFATMGEIHHEQVDIPVMKQKSAQFKFFNIYPEDGIFEKNETKLFKFRFSPVELDLTTRRTPYYFCIVVMHRFRCSSLNQENVVDYNVDLSSIYQSQILSTYDPSLGSSQIDIFELLSSCHYLLDENAYYRLNLDSINDLIRIYLYATAEVPSVKIIPDEINIENMQRKVCETRTLQFQNMSKRLPIILKYNKTAFISLSDEKLYLKPLEKREISVQISSPNIGNKIINLTFDLMYYDEPRENGSCKVIGKAFIRVKYDVISVTKYPTPELNLGLRPNYIKEVGKHCQGIKFSTPLKHAKCITIYEAQQLDKKCEDLVAFPNDTQQSLRPCRASDTYRSIFTRQSRYVAPVNSQYELRRAELLQKNKLKRYYTNYVREQCGTRSKSTSVLLKNDDYDIVPAKKLLCSDTKFGKLPCTYSHQESKPMYFLPLTPREMNNIIVLPAIVKTKRIACNYTYDFRIKVVNKNNAPIRVLLCSDRLNLIFNEGNRHIVEKKQERLIKISYNAGPTGYYTSNLFLVINESTVLNVPILADVVPVALHADHKKVVLKNRNDHQYVELKNEINVEVPYYWDIEHQTFAIEPSSGHIDIGRKIVCVITYRLDVEGPNECSARLSSGSSYTQIIRLSVQEAEAKLLLLKNVNFDAIPLNEPTRDTIIIKNCHLYAIKYHIKEEELPKGLIVFPVNANIDPMGVANMYLTAQFTNCFKFNYIVKVYSYHGVALEIPIQGFVVYPEVVITPNTINTGKICANTVTTANFTIQNYSKATTKIRFDMTEYDEFHISDHHCPWQRTQLEEFYMKAQSTKTLYLHFFPSAASFSVFYLPIIINDILGPPLITDVSSTRTNYYLIDSVQSFEILSTPKNIPCVKVRTLVTVPKICISKTVIEFCTFVRQKEAFSSITISNPQDTDEAICIRTDELKHPVYIDRTEGISEDLKTRSIVLYLKPGDTITFKISFIPNTFDFGEYHVNLPVFLRSDNSMKEHNVITITAEYHRPNFSILFSDGRFFDTIQGSLKTDYLYCYRPLALCFKWRAAKLKIMCEGHLEDCSIKVNTESTNSTVKWDTQERTKTILDDKGSYSIEVKSFFLDLGNLEHYEQFDIQCTCGGIWRARSQGAVEASLLTAYADIENQLKRSSSGKAMPLPTQRAKIPRTRNSRPRNKTGGVKRLIIKNVKMVISRNNVDKLQNLPINLGYTSIPFFKVLSAFNKVPRYFQQNISNTPNSLPSYPFFPDASYKHIKFVIGCCECAELWLNTQVLFGLWKYSIPDAISFPCLEPASQQTIERQTQLSLLPILHILGNIIGPEVLTTLKQREIPSDEIEKVKALYEINEGAIDFMKKHGATLTTMRPEHLLSFDHFLLYYKEIFNYNEYPYPQSLAIINIEEFFRLSKQCWLDFVLQMYKALYLKKLVDKYEISSSKGKLKDTPLQEFFSANYERIRLELYSESESLILNWLQFHYNNNKDKVWGTGQKLPNLNVDFYNDTLNNGLVFAVIIVTYCPYLRRYVEDVYLSPCSPEEAYHNNVRVIQCLEMLNYTFRITPDQIMEGHSIRLLMFSVYLFEVLPQMFPIETITMKTDLSTVTTRKLEVFNQNNFPISYKLILIGIPKGCFTTKRDLLEIPKGKKSSITIQYFAKFAKKIECVLLLSGEVLGYRYAINKCVTLIGIPNIEYPCAIIDYKQELYKAEYYDFVVQSPYKGAATYVMKQTYDIIDKPLELSSVIYNLDSDRIACGRVVLLNKSFDFDDNGQCRIHCVVGDFAIKFVSAVKETKQRESLKIRIPSTMTKTEDTWDTLWLDIPNRNSLFYSGIKSLLVKLTEGEESKLWERVAETEMGVNILETLFLSSADAAVDSPFRCKSKEYIVILDTKANVKLPETILFEDECSAGFTRVPLTVKNNKEPIKEFSLILDSKELRRKRYYTVCFSK